MLRLVTVLTILLVSPALGAAQSPLVGVWQVLTAENPDGEVTEITQPRYSAWFDNGYYVLMWDLAAEPRATLGDDPTDAELVAAWGPVLAEFGTYEVSGSSYTRHALVNKNPNSQGVTLATREFSVEGNTLRTTGAGLNTFTYRRVR
jgi:hypothetical protein